MKALKTFLIFFGISITGIIGLMFILSRVFKNENDYMIAFMNDHGYAD